MRECCRRIAGFDRRMSNYSAYNTLKKTASPPNVGAILGAVAGLIPPFKRTLLTDGAPLFFFSDALATLGDAAIPVTMITLGATLSEGPGAGNLPTRVVVGMVLGRLVLVPLIGVGVVYAAYLAGIVPVVDRMFLFVMMSIHAMPSAMNLQVGGHAARGGRTGGRMRMSWGPQGGLCLY